MITVVNVRRRHPSEMPETFVYVGRQNGNWRASPLGNPYRPENFSVPDGAIFAYRRWLWKRIQDRNSVQFQELQRLAALVREGDLQLGCWCAPYMCHATIIKDAIEWLLTL